MLRLSLFFLILISTSVYSQELTCSLRGTHIHYLNGVANTEDNAIASATALEKQYANSPELLDKRKILSFDYTHNRTFGFLEDFLESGAQKFHLKAKELGVDISVRSAFRLIFQTTLALPATLFPEILGPYLLLIYREANERANNERTDVSNITSDLKEILEQDKKLIIVSHSQGNLFANRALEELEVDSLFNYDHYKKVIANVRFATPIAQSFAYHSLHVTNSKDFINALSDQTDNYDLNPPFPLLDLRPTLDVFSNHGFLETYLFNVTADLPETDYLYAIHLPLLELRTKSLETIEKSALMLDAHPRCPKAVINYRVNPSDELEIILDSTDPNDPFINGLVYKWSIEDGTEKLTDSHVFYHSFPQPGKYKVQLTVTTDDGADFGPDAFAERYIDIGRREIYGCGNALGLNHINPDGSIGGFVANTATVANTSYISPSVSICGNSQVLGVSKLKTTCLLCNSKILDTTVIDSSLELEAFIEMKYSIISDVQVTGSGWDISTFKADVTHSSFNMNIYRGILINWSTVTDFNYSGDFVNIHYTTINGWTIHTNETDGGIMIYEDGQIWYRGRTGSYSDWPDFFFSE